jgi:hypothetical protein
MNTRYTRITRSTIIWKKYFLRNLTSLGRKITNRAKIKSVRSKNGGCYRNFGVPVKNPKKFFVVRM